MHVIYGTGRLTKKYKNVVAAIGVFDAVHRGHQKVIARAVKEARRLHDVSVVVTFDPHPVSVLHPQKFSAYVVTLEHRLRLIAQCGADVCCVIPFTKRFSKMGALDFVDKVLVGGLGVRKVVVGEDFHFGCDRAGSFDFLKKQGLAKDFLTESVPTYKLNNINIKTKKIRKLVASGDLRLLKRFLGRDYSLMAEVESGDARGRKLGYPTANLRRENVVILPPGIYAVRVDLDGKKKWGVFYIGTRSTFKKAQREYSQELHVLDYKGDLYGKKVLVEFLKKVRDDMRFSDGKSLVLQIARDIAFARKFFSKIS